MVKSFDEYKSQGTIREIAPNEKEPYISFLKTTYEDNVRASEFLLLKFPRWSIIAGYYAMHDISKLYLAKKYNLKVSQPDAHSAVIQALRELVQRKDIIKLMEMAEAEYEEIISLHMALLRAKEEREKSQYYTSAAVKPSVAMQKASYFLEKLVKPYINLINLMENDS